MAHPTENTREAFPRVTAGWVLCAECDMHLTRRDDSICYRCNEKRDQDSLLNTLMPETRMRFTPDDKCACVGKPELFFPQGPVPNEAKQLCASCPVQSRCLDWATENDADGIWAGLTRAQRRARKKSLTRADVTLVA